VATYEPERVHTPWIKFTNIPNVQTSLRKSA